MICNQDMLSKHNKYNHIGKSMYFYIYVHIYKYMCTYKYKNHLVKI